MQKEIKSKEVYIDADGYINPPKSDDEYFKESKEERIKKLRETGAPDAIVQAAENGILWKFFVAHVDDNSHPEYK